jgi:hypothetical protein
MRGLYHHSPNTPSWRGAQLEKGTGTLPSVWYCFLTYSYKSELLSKPSLVCCYMSLRLSLGFSSPEGDGKERGRKLSDVCHANRIIRKLRVVMASTDIIWVITQDLKLSRTYISKTS